MKVAPPKPQQQKAISEKPAKKKAMNIAQPKTQQKTNSEKPAQKTNKGKKKFRFFKHMVAPQPKKHKPTSDEIKKMEIPEHLKDYPNILSIRKFNPNFFLLLVNGEIKTKKVKAENSQMEKEAAPPQCYVCKEEGHLAKKCPSKAYKKHKLSQEDLQNIKCFKCGELGHTSKDCKAGPAASNSKQVNSKKEKLKCYNCKEEGHLAKDCLQPPAKKLKTSQRPAPSKTPKLSQRPASSKTPKPSQRPAPSKTPKPSQHPAPSKTPKPSAQQNGQASPKEKACAATTTKSPSLKTNNSVSKWSTAKEQLDAKASANNAGSKTPALTPVVAIDCEMVGVGEGGKESNLARVSIVNQFGECLYDKYVKPVETVTDYRTHVSGIRPELLVNALDLKTAQKDVADIIDKKILVGHALKNDLKCLFLGHPRNKIRDTSRYGPFKQLFSGRTPSLKNLSLDVLGVPIQSGEHDSVEDARAAMMLYTRVRKEWERQISKQKVKKTSQSILNQVL